MCGIAGVLDAQATPEKRAALVAQMLRHQSHRGPDDSGVWSGDTATLGICRLAILDLSAQGNPIVSYDKNLDMTSELLAKVKAQPAPKLPEPAAPKKPPPGH